MGTDNKSKYILYIEDVKVGTLSGSESGDLEFTAIAWKSCRTRKRFIRLMMGVIGIDRNQATALANAVAQSNRSYGDVWADFYANFIRRTLVGIASSSNNA